MTPSTIVCKLLLVLLVISPAVHAWPYDCNTTATPCFRPNCTCASYTAPDIIPSNDVPMFVKVSMDDWVVDIGTQLIYGATGPNYTDARGCTPRLTLYTATRYTDFRLAEQVFKDGHEIAVHTVSHSTNYTSTKEKWEYEIGNCKKYLETLSEVPDSQITGFRAPYLGFSPTMFTVMQEFNLSYDSSMVCNPVTKDCPYGKFFWPYTLDYGPAITCGVSDGNICPDNTPGVWEVPMTMLFDPRVPPSETNGSMFMDPEGPADYPGGLLQLLKDNFHKRYDGDRAPFSIHYHARTLASDPARVSIVQQFLQYVAGLQDVFFVTDGQLVQWMKNPVPASLLRNSGDTYLPSCAATSNSSSSTGCANNTFPTKCYYPEQTFMTCASCPEYWPSVCLDGACQDNEECTCPQDCPNKPCSNIMSWPGSMTNTAPVAQCINIHVNNTGADTARNWRLAAQASNIISKVTGWGWTSVTGRNNQWVFEPLPQYRKVVAGGATPPPSGQIGICWAGAGKITLADAFPNGFQITLFKHDCVNTPCPGICMDGVCDAGETASSCPQDCNGSGSGTTAPVATTAAPSATTSAPADTTAPPTSAPVDTTAPPDASATTTMAPTTNPPSVGAGAA